MSKQINLHALIYLHGYHQPPSEDVDLTRREGEGGSSHFAEEWSTFTALISGPQHALGCLLGFRRKRGGGGGGGWWVGGDDLIVSDVPQIHSRAARVLLGCNLATPETN